MSPNLSFLQPDAEGAPPARSPIADASGARTEVRDGWEVAVSFGDPAGEARAIAETVGVADCSHLGKLELQGARDALAATLGRAASGEAADDGAAGQAPALGGSARTADGAWLLPVTPTRALVVADPAATPALRDALAADGVHVLDVSTTFGALTIAGPLARETFARFCAIDLRDKVTPVHAFRPGSVARTPGYVLREAPERYLMLFGAAYGEYVWQVVTDAARHLGGRPVGVDALTREEGAVHA